MRWILVGALVACAILGAAAGGGYWWLTRRATAIATAPLDVPADSVAVPTDSASLAEGERIAWLRGCHGCHADSLEGKVFVDEPRVLRLTAPNIPSAIRAYSDGELARLIRHGVTRTGRPVFAMPAATYYHLSDADLGRLIAHLRATPVREHPLAPTELRLFTMIGLVQGAVHTDAGTMDHHAPRLGDRTDTSRVARGEYLARTICAECHGPDMRGKDANPAIPHALGYTLPQFVSLLWDGRARDGRDIGLMGVTAQRRFSRFTHDEIEAIFAYLQTVTFAPPPAARP